MRIGGGFEDYPHWFAERESNETRGNGATAAACIGSTGNGFVESVVGNGGGGIWSGVGCGN